jgi:hypothetical protein
MQEAIKKFEDINKATKSNNEIFSKIMNERETEKGKMQEMNVQLNNSNIKSLNS